MAKWRLDKNTKKEHDGGTETITYEATVTLEGDNEGDQITLGELATLIEGLTSVDGIPTGAKLGTTLVAPLRWTDADLP